MSQLRDFYLRPETDPAYRPEQLEVHEDLESALQQIKMTLFTKKGEVLNNFNIKNGCSFYPSNPIKER